MGLISYKDRVTNKEFKRKIRAAIGAYEELSIVIQWKLRWLGHASDHQSYPRCAFRRLWRNEEKRTTEDQKGGEYKRMDRSQLG